MKVDIWISGYLKKNIICNADWSFSLTVFSFRMINQTIYNSNKHGTNLKVKTSKTYVLKSKKLSTKIGQEGEV